MENDTKNASAAPAVDTTKDAQRAPNPAPAAPVAPDTQRRERDADKR